MTPIIVDTNIVFTALVNKNSAIASFLLDPQRVLLMPKFFSSFFSKKLPLVNPESSSYKMQLNRGRMCNKALPTPLS
jgi:hypothetical protein